MSRTPGPTTPTAWLHPYLQHAPDLAFVIAEHDAAAGYLLGVTDTAAFHSWCEGTWWPAWHTRYPSGRGTGRVQGPDRVVLALARPWTARGPRELTSAGPAPRSPAAS